MKKNKNIIIYFLVFSFAFIVYSCVSYPFIIKDDSGELLSPTQLMLQGYMAYAKGAFDVALQYYQVIIDQYPNEKEFLGWAYYEIGFIYYVQDNYDEAKIYFEKVVNEYNYLPAAVKLSKNMIEIIKNKLKK